MGALGELRATQRIATLASLSRAILSTGRSADAYTTRIMAVAVMPSTNVRTLIVITCRFLVIDLPRNVRCRHLKLLL